VKFPVFEIVTLWLFSTPAVNAAVVPPAVRFPVEVTVAVETNPVTVLLYMSCAVIVAIVNGVPAVWEPIVVIAK
jgi:hypothetical protein